MSFFKSVLSTLTALFIFCVIFLFLFIPAVIGVLVATSSEEVPVVEENSVLYINLSGMISERVAEDPLAELFAGPNEMQIPLLKTLDAIAAAKNDNNIKGIYLSHGYVSGGYAALNEIRLALEDFKSSGKFIYSYGEYISEGNYYVTSVADEIILNPIGSLEFNGLNASVTFFKGLFDKLDIEAQIFRVGTYKSAVEPFFRKDMSAANKEQMTSFVNDIYDHILKNISISRNIEIDRLREISDQMLVRKAEDAAELGLVTKVAYETDVKEMIKTELGLSADEKIKFIRLNGYIKTVDNDYSSNKVAVIVADGEIVSGSGDMETVGSDKFVKAIQKARESKRVKAVVIRVNSPGGSMVASDVMWNEIMLTKKEKPVIASMSNMAASGGYYLSMPCDTIVAQPMTITGSIGIFGMIPNLGSFLENKLGITNDGVSTGQFSDLYRVSSALNEQEKNIIQTSVEQGYETFTSKAAEGRRMTQDDIKAVASGRVWTGRQAKERGLVDVLGTYNDAVQLAAAAAGISDDYAITYYPQLKSKWEELFSTVLDETETRIFHKNYGQMAKYIDAIQELEKYQGVQARMPFDIELK
ncbi:signal peptide peptidase SppA [Reichenbachiella carrageenanivorans]|uniref:Signal peptide peptidase SppA n=1 Tax=Reichenbachiella carrageenanivorans TaxID=2979869 RepID=A0ABY6CWQ3_9BACT|nr:signal peptide peptidase SppA [Reichenbachiella carrageenanivorans]UXX78340.1 signal peptide peptidase SppA [Reichenbachiella carrageenanivorans]